MDGDVASCGAVRLGLIGVGRWGRRLLGTIRSIEGVTLALVASGNPETAALVPEARVVGDWKKLLAADLDGVVIATPPACHGVILRAFVAAGVPVMVEKPLCLDVAEAYELRSLVASSGVPVLVDHTQLFHPGFTALQARARDLGPVRFVRSEGMAFGPFRTDVTVLWDWTPHDIALCLDLLRAVPNRVSAIGNHASVALWLDFGAQTSALILNSNVSLEKRRRLTVHFDHHVLVLDDRAAAKLVEHKVDLVPHSEHSPEPTDGVALPVPVGLPLTRAVSHFVQGVAGGDLTGFGLDLACDVIHILDKAQRLL